MAWQGAFHPTTPLSGGRGPAGGSTSHLAPASDNTRWGGFPHQGSSNERLQIPPAGTSSTALVTQVPGASKSQPTTPGPARALVPASPFGPGPVATSSQVQPTQAGSLATKPQWNQISSRTPSKSAAGTSMSSAVVASTKTAAASPTMGTGDMLAQPFTRSLLANRAKWNGIALAGLFILPRLAIVQGATSAALTIVSVVTAGLFDSSVESLGEYAEHLAKIIVAINLVDALVRLQSKTAEEKAAAGKSAKAGSADKTAAPRLSLGVRSSPQVGVGWQDA
ncbi:hypothetical protein OC846_000015 [Tilletia horrida]|uniref:Uncharacterized protein n=1 Tax=Tilletia horrida TaxID=155126 RepID=A0AAN6GV09_9BASI|nr:hypothetical protein OC846_000015 [Tilletia horrida]